MSVEKRTRFGATIAAFRCSCLSLLTVTLIVLKAFVFFAFKCGRRALLRRRQDRLQRRIPPRPYFVHVSRRVLRYIAHYA